MDKIDKHLYNSDIMFKNINNFEISFLGYYQKYNVEIDVQQNNRYELQYIASGGVCLEFNGKVYELETGSCWINTPGIRYQYHPSKKYGFWEHRFVVFKGDICNSWDKLGLIPSFPCHVPAKLNFAKRIDRLIELSEVESQLNKLESMNIVEKMLIDIKRDNSTDKIFPQWLNVIISKLDKRTLENIDYIKLSSKYGITRRTFFRNFKRATGMTPHAYCLKRKIQYAAELLETTDIPIKEIAEMAGYKDIFYFSRQFKQMIGEPPAKFRATNHKRIKQNSSIVPR